MTRPETTIQITKINPVTCGPSIIGFGIYDYKYESGHQGSAPIIAFSPRKSALTFYVYSPTDASKIALAGPGTFKITK